MDSSLHATNNVANYSYSLLQGVSIACYVDRATHSARLSKRLTTFLLTY